MLSTGFKRTLATIAIIGLLLLAAFVWIRHTIQQVFPAPSHSILPANTKERITYDENKHVIAVTTAKGTTASYSRNPTVEIKNDGTVKVDSNAWGLEADPFLGIGYQETGRLYLGVNGFYYRQFDAFAAIGIPFNGDHSIKPLVGASWNVFRHSSIGVGLNPFNAILRERPEFGVLLTVKL